MIIAASQHTDILQIVILYTSVFNDNLYQVLALAKLRQTVFVFQLYSVQSSRN